MLARVKQDYLAGPVTAFSGHEYVRSEWREVPAGFEEQAKNHPLLDTQPSMKEIRTGSSGKPGLGKQTLEEPAVTAVTEESPAAEPLAEESAVVVDEPAVTPAIEESEEEHKTSRRRRRTGSED